MLAAPVVLLILVLATLSNAKSDSLRVQSAQDEEEAAVTSRSFSQTNVWNVHDLAPQSVSVLFVDVEFLVGALAFY